MSPRYALRTDCGRERKNNEDCARVVAELGLFVIADGMGGHVAGEVASGIAVSALVDFLQKHDPPADPADEAQRLGQAISAANQAVQQEARRRNLRGMGTTLTALWLRKRTATICHVGDTRVGLLEAGELRPLTQDHTVVGLLLEGGLISREAASEHPERHMLTQAIGTQDLIEPDIEQLQIPEGARLLLSTDGLHDVVPPAEIVELASQPDLDQAARDLIDRANACGGPDNITLILIDP